MIKSGIDQGLQRKVDANYAISLEDYEFKHRELLNFAWGDYGPTHEYLTFQLLNKLDSIGDTEYADLTAFLKWRIKADYYMP